MSVDWPAPARLAFAGFAWRIRLLTVLLSALTGSVSLADNARPIVNNSLRSDAALHDVCFVDAQHGWAVGDRGTIWQTEDGGQHWRLQESGVDAQLRGVKFVDPQVGWVVGGRWSQLAGRSSGILLRTRDGGRTWTSDEGLLLPALRSVGFFSGADGWAIGEASSLFPSGVFTTDNGGRTWAPLTGADGSSGWLTGDFVDPFSGALAGRSGPPVVVRRRGLESSITPPFGLRQARQMRLSNEGRGWLVGDGSLVMQTTDFGATWQTPTGPLPDAIADRFDWRALAVVGSKCWIAGTPGSRVLHSPDGGQSWTLLETGQPLPILALAFSDELHGWAVGALGRILTTDDGGRTWQQQRAGGSRAAVLGVYGEAEQVPLELLARLSGNDGYLAHVELIARHGQDNLTSRDASLPERAHEAMVSVGACGADTSWRFPLRQEGLDLSSEQFRDGWDRVNDGAGIGQLERHLVRQLRTWRPEVVFAPPIQSRVPNPLDQLVVDAVLRAVEQANDPTSHSEQLVEMGLQPWKVKKVFTTSATGDGSSISLTTAQIAPRLGGSLADRAAIARSLIVEEPTAPPPSMGFRLSYCSLPADSAKGDFFSGITLSPGGEARRYLENPPVDNHEALRRAAQKHRNIQQIMLRADNEPAGGARLTSQVQDLVSGLEGEEAGRVLHELATRCWRSGRWDLAADTFESLATRYPRHRLAPTAQLWLVQYWSSDEAAWRVMSTQRGSVHRATAPTARAAPAAQGEDKGVQPASFEQEEQTNSVVMADPAVMQERWKKASEWGKAVERTSPALFAEPALRFPLAVAHRRQGYPRQSERYYLSMRHGSAAAPWAATAIGEHWLAEPQGAPPKRAIRCRRAASKPHLDGRLDEAWWPAQDGAELHSSLRDDADWPAVTLLAYDDEFLYVGVQCRKPPGVKYEEATGPRPRDGDLAQHDRVDIFLDLDRDAATYYRLSVDHRGWTGDECWGDRTWDPSWFVASQHDQDSWTIEAAIPLAELTGQKPASRAAWSIGVQRTVPGVGFQSWTSPAAIRVQPEGFGYLLFD